MTTTNKFKDPNLTEEEQDAIIGSFVRQREDTKLKKRWTEKLAKEHNLNREVTSRRNPAKIRKISFLLLSAAAALLFLIVFLPSLMMEDGNALLADNLSEITLNGSRSAAATEDPTSVEILRIQFRDNFQAGDFAAAAKLGEQLIALPAVTDNDRLNLGFAYLRASQFSEAEKTFRGLLAVNSEFASEARYYLGGTLLAAGDTEAGLDELRKINAADGGRLLESAKELLDANWK